jgi:hypothetical protein
VWAALSHPDLSELQTFPPLMTSAAMHHPLVSEAPKALLKMWLQYVTSMERLFLRVADTFSDVENAGLGQHLTSNAAHTKRLYYGI